jgi:L-fucose isomerase-like protein
MRKLRIKFLTHTGAPDEVYEKGYKLLDLNFPEEIYEVVDTKPDILFFLTGGSEREAINAGAFIEKIVLLTHDEDNSHAAATEVKAYLDTEDQASVVWSIYESNIRQKAIALYNTFNALEKLRDQELGLIGTISDWLIASDIDPVILKDKFGIYFAPLTWDAIPSFKSCEPSEDFLNHFKSDNNPKLKEAAQIHTLLKKTIKENHLDAITVECFPLVKEQKVTACLSLSLLNDLGIPAGCEGDIVSITGMMFTKALIDIIPWMANTVKVTHESAIFAHCTVPLSYVKSYTIPTHFETDEGTAIQGILKPDVVTVFRFDNQLKKAFVASGIIKDRPKSPHNCRTQIEVSLPAEKLNKLRNNPLGNHHLIIEGDLTLELKTAFEWINVEVI